MGKIPLWVWVVFVYFILRCFPDVAWMIPSTMFRWYGWLAAMAPDIGTAMGKTPLWVWAVLAYIIYIGVRALRPQSVYPPTLLILPLALMFSKFHVFFDSAPYIYIGMLTLGGLWGVRNAIKMPLVIVPSGRLVIPASMAPLFILITFFCAKYIFGLMRALNPELAQSWSWVDVSASGLLPGYNWGKGLTLCARFFTR